jgi:hypothetical protein
MLFSPQDFDLRGIDETTPVCDSAPLQLHCVTLCACTRTASRLVHGDQSSGRCPRAAGQRPFLRLRHVCHPVTLDFKEEICCSLTHVLSPAAVFGPGDKLVSDSHVINKGHVVIGTGSALIDWV